MIQSGSPVLWSWIFPLLFSLAVFLPSAWLVWPIWGYIFTCSYWLRDAGYSLMNLKFYKNTGFYSHTMKLFGDGLVAFTFNINIYKYICFLCSVFRVAKHKICILKHLHPAHMTVWIKIQPFWVWKPFVQWGPHNTKLSSDMLFPVLKQAEWLIKCWNAPVILFRVKHIVWNITTM